MNKREKPDYCSVGGQGVIEGVMMKSPTHSALAVRKEDGSITTKEWDNKIRKSKIAKWPVIRGVVNFVDTMIMGVGTITDAAKMLDEANAMSELSSQAVDEAQALEEKYKSADTNASVEDELAALKLKMGLGDDKP